MARKGNIFGKNVEYVKKFNVTSIGRRPKPSSMNKNKRKSYKIRDFGHFTLRKVTL